MKARRLRLVLVAAWLVATLTGAASVAADAAPAPPAPIRAARFDRPPVIDGRLDDEVWATATRLTGFHQVQPGDNLEPSQPTEVRIGHDRRALYLAFRATDTSGRVRATRARRDAIGDEDAVGVYLDTFHDRRRAYYVFFNPYGVQADGVYTEGQEAPDLTVDLVLDSQGVVDAGGYTVEASIPFASLRYHSGASPVWGLHVQRFIRRDRNEQISWAPLSRDRSSLLAQAGELGQFVDVGDGRPLEIIPTGVVTQIGALGATGLVDRRADADPGLTVSYGLTPTMSAAFTANADFAQVEADQLVLTVNQRFPIFYDEKRPFFLEGLDTFQTPLNLVHTRTIVDPAYAVKLTGKQGRTTVGALVAADAGARAALRVKRDVGRDSTIGATTTAVHEGTRFSHLISADARLRLDDRTVVTTQVAGSVARMPFRDPTTGDAREREGRGVAWHTRLERRTRHTLTQLTASGSSPDYRADLGFLRRRNTNALALQTTWTSEPKPDARVISWSLTNVVHAQGDWQGRATWIYVYPQVRLNLRRQTFVQVFAYRDYERIFEEEFGVTRGPGRRGAFVGDSERSTSWEGFIAQAGTSPAEAIACSVTWSNSFDVFDYDFGAGPRFPRVSPAALIDPAAPLDPGPATSRSLAADVTWRPLDALRLSIAASRDRLVRHDTGRVAYDATLVSWRTTWQLTRFAFLRLRTDWDSASATLRGQYLAGWTPSPGTAIYAGYNDEALVDGADPRTGLRWRGYHQTGRTLFVKMSYMLRHVL